MRCFLEGVGLLEKIYYKNAEKIFSMFKR